MHYDFTAYYQQLYQYIETLQRRIEELEYTVENLQSEFNNLKQHHSNRPEKIEYKFDQLKVERLEGTLNIGITPTGGIEPSSFEDFAINQNRINVPDQPQQESMVFENIKKDVHDYLNTDCFNTLQSIEQHYNQELDPQYRSFIVEDIKKQIDNRIQYYLRGTNEQPQSEDELMAFQEKTTSKIKSDINRTIEEFIKHLPLKGD